MLRNSIIKVQKGLRDVRDNRKEAQRYEKPFAAFLLKEKKDKGLCVIQLERNLIIRILRGEINYFYGIYGTILSHSYDASL